MMSAKYKAELDFWKQELVRYQQWYDGKISLNGQPPLPEHMRDFYVSPQEAWVECFQKPHYLSSLGCSKSCFAGKKVLEIGCGPVSGSRVFEGATIAGIDPLLHSYTGIGYTVDFLDRCAFAEFIPFLDNTFDAVISVNSLDHVDFLDKVAGEIHRVCAPNFMIAINVEYHKPRICEPIVVDDVVMKFLFPTAEKKGVIENRHTWRNF